MKIISASIDVTKLDKSRFYKGNKGTYANLTIRLNDDADQYGNHGMVTESVSKEERASGVRGPILGNVKVVFDDEAGGGPHPESAPKGGKAHKDDFEDSEIPF